MPKSDLEKSKERHNIHEINYSKKVISSHKKSDSRTKMQIVQDLPEEIEKQMISQPSIRNCHFSVQNYTFPLVINLIGIGVMFSASGTAHVENMSTANR